MMRKPKPEQLRGRCACSEGYIARYIPGTQEVEEFVPTGLYKHDCQYVKLRNSYLNDAERLAEQRGILFLKAMDYLMKPFSGVADSQG